MKIYSAGMGGNTAQLDSYCRKTRATFQKIRTALCGNAKNKAPRDGLTCPTEAKNMAKLFTNIKSEPSRSRIASMKMYSNSFGGSAAERD